MTKRNESSVLPAISCTREHELSFLSLSFFISNIGMIIPPWLGGCTPYMLKFLPSECFFWGLPETVPLWILANLVHGRNGWSFPRALRWEKCYLVRTAKPTTIIKGLLFICHSCSYSLFSVRCVDIPIFLWGYRGAEELKTTWEWPLQFVWLLTLTLHWASRKQLGVVIFL